MKIRREWQMPNSATFQIKPIRELLERLLQPGMIVVDPFAGNSTFATHTNDLNPSSLSSHHMEATQFCEKMLFQGIKADVVLFDPPYSPRQISEVYRSVGMPVGRKETQNGRLYKEVKGSLASLLKAGGVSVSCGWNSSGFGLSRGFEIEEILLVCHGGAHNDTIVTVERKTRD